jgi:hypothetical protein
MAVVLNKQAYQHAQRTRKCFDRRSKAGKGPLNLKINAKAWSTKQTRR